MNRRTLGASAVWALVMGGCSGGGSSTPTSPSTPTPTPQANRNPQITATSTTAFGSQQLSTFSFSGSASDADGDSLTFAWDIAGNPVSGTSGSMSFTGVGNGTARLTVTDGKGGTATDTRTFIVGSATGRWAGTWDRWQMVSNLLQSSSLITGDYSDQLGPGRLDPAVANTIDANGNVRLRYKSSVFSDFIFTGTLDSTGRKITGVVNGSGYNNFPFTITK